ncbi:MAG TPA: tetraacyldisaccharide 4'-kinase [Cyclobacteriaceae bacterium]|jgi:tetraacyldisaccharide 4'-kinase|nr:tetraacyldisaccharide 4'-kinase [Cyclobacteriaceae bacterium]
MLSILLFPFAFLFGVVTRVRNFLYNIGWKKSYSFQPAVICVGNLNVGGSGKTPMIEYLVNLLKEKYSLAILSRGYGRVTRGFLLAEMHDDASTIGDEPFQYYRKYGNQLPIVVCESRVEGITKLMKKRPNVQVILLDDAFQHRAVKPLFSVLLTDFSKPFFKDHLLPQGRLRESRSGSSRADALVVTKCFDISGEVESRFKLDIQSYAGSKPVFFSGVKYNAPKAVEGEKQLGKDVVLVTGIANSKPIVDYVSSHFNLVQHFQFKDHYQYSLGDIKVIQQRANATASILTTEKDLVKLIAPNLNGVMNKKLWFYLPIETVFLNRGSEFDKLITMKIEAHLKSSLPIQNQK